ncbi:histidine-phosphotransfer domain, HPT domain-containing protein [Auricularia subglabra TFB-10046 SS5]|nr:histidine-phosphotransfer domain, HPT domain-containing protein [Auricularia subglabra TFB-10046 SS5]
MAATTAAGTRSSPERRSPYPPSAAGRERTTSPPPVARTSSPVVPARAKSEDKDSTSSSDVIINMDTFQQLLELEEDDTYEFSIGMTQAYFSQAETTFKDMDKALAAKDLKKLSELGHFLKGSSAALGVQKVQESCEKMQNYGKLHDGHDHKLTESDALDRITTILGRVKTEYSEAEKYLNNWYSEHGASL